MGVEIKSAGQELVELLKYYECPCGMGGYRYEGRTRHTSHHMKWADGIALGSNGPYWYGSGLRRVEPESPRPEKRVAYNLGVLMQREEGYDFPLYPNPSYAEEFPAAYVAVWDDRAIGMVVIGVARFWGA
jgi:hypothetical protein